MVCHSSYTTEHYMTSSKKWVVNFSFTRCDVSLSLNSAYKGFHIFCHLPSLIVSFTCIQEVQTRQKVYWGSEHAGHTTRQCTHTNTNIPLTLGICRFLSCCCHSRIVCRRHNQMLTLPTRTHLPTWIVRLCRVELRSFSSSLTRRGLYWSSRTKTNKQKTQETISKIKM